jgi:hypothetical protein
MNIGSALGVEKVRSRQCHGCRRTSASICACASRALRLVARCIGSTSGPIASGSCAPFFMKEKAASGSGWVGGAPEACGARMSA